MTDTVFCYYCRKHHPAAEVTLVQSRGVKRWRCQKSIAYGQKSRDQRDAFGKSVSEMNRLMCVSSSVRSLPRPVLELLHSVPGNIEGLA
jgi:hypothetical protein